ncbi:Piwi domain, partial [Dillenia turbinata]
MEIFGVKVHGKAGCEIFEELLLILPAINLMSSPSKSVKAVATNLLYIVEGLSLNLLSTPSEVVAIPRGSLSVSKHSTIILRLLQHLSFEAFEDVLNIAAVLVMHGSSGSYALDSLAAIGRMDPWMDALPLQIVGDKNQDTVVGEMKDDTGATVWVVEYFRDKFGVEIYYSFLPALQAGTDSKPAYLPKEEVKIKKICKTELGIFSQCIQPKQAQKNRKQYHENVALKINVRVGFGQNVFHLNSNSGTIIDTTICSPAEFDFYLKSYAGVQVKKALEGVRGGLTYRDHARQDYWDNSSANKPIDDDKGATVWVVEYCCDKYGVEIYYSFLQALQGGTDSKTWLFAYGGDCTFKSNMSTTSGKENSIKREEQFKINEIVNDEFGILVSFELSALNARVWPPPMQFNPNPIIPLRRAPASQIDTALIHKECTATGKYLHLLIIILQDITGSYCKIKKICETELGIQALKNSKQYHDNVALKINVKTVEETIIVKVDVSPHQLQLYVVALTDWPFVNTHRGLISSQTHRDEIVHMTCTKRKRILRGAKELLIAFRRTTTSQKP